MKTPSKNVSASLRGQKVAGRGAEKVTVSAMSDSKPSMTVPGEGGVEMPVGTRHERSAAEYTDPMKRFGGK
jgi:hypothetical protein